LKQNVNESQFFSPYNARFGKARTDWRQSDQIFPRSRFRIVPDFDAKIMVREGISGFKGASVITPKLTKPTAHL